MSFLTSAKSSGDLESGKKSAGVTITADVESEKTSRPVLGRRKTSERATGTSTSTEKLVYDGEEDALTKIGNFFYRVHSASILTRYALYILPVAALLAIPVVCLSNTYKTRSDIFIAGPHSHCLRRSESR